MSRAMCLAMLCALCAPALGSPRSDPTMGRAVFTGAATGNATSIDVNPAAIGLGPTRAEQLEQIPNEIYIAALGVLDRYSIERRAIDVDTGAQSPAGDLTQHTMSPGFALAGIWHTGTDGRITLAAQVRSSPAERFLEDESLRYHTLGGYHRTSSVGVAASLRLTGRLYIGVGFATESSFLKLRYARDTALEAGRDPDRGIDSDCGNGMPCGVENPLAAERYEVEADSGLFSAAISLGAVVRLARDVWLGIGYHAPPNLAIQTELTGEMHVRRAPRDQSEQLEGGATVFISEPASLDVGLRARLPRLLDLHVGLRWEDLSRFQRYDVRGYGSTFTSNGILEWQPRPRGYHDTFALWAGIEQVEHDSPVIAGARIGVETSALDSERTSPLTVAPTSLTVDAGVQYRLGTVVLQASYGLQFFPTVNVTESAFDPRSRLICIETGYDYNEPSCEAVRGGYAIPTALGEYQRLEHALRLAVRIELP